MTIYMDITCNIDVNYNIISITYVSATVVFSSYIGYLFQQLRIKAYVYACFCVFAYSNRLNF